MSCPLVATLELMCILPLRHTSSESEKARLLFLRSPYYFSRIEILRRAYPSFQQKNKQARVSFVAHQCHQHRIWFQSCTSEKRLSCFFESNPIPIRSEILIRGRILIPGLIHGSLYLLFVSAPIPNMIGMFISRRVGATGRVILSVVREPLAGLVPLFLFELEEVIAL